MPSEGALRDGSSAGFQLIETLRFEPASGFVRLERHMARLSASAAALGFSCNRALIDKALADAAGADTPLRVRLTLGREGTASVTTASFQPLASGVVWTLAVATNRLASSDPLLRHKTTRRAVYEAARAGFSAQDADEVILLNERDELCEGTITSIFIDRGDGVLLTPPLSSGLLAGVLRAELLDTGKAREAVLGLHDLHSAASVHVGNSLRGLISVDLKSAQLAQL